VLLHKPLLRNRNGAQNGAVFFVVRLVRCWLLKRARHTQFGGFGTKCARSPRTFPTAKEAVVEHQFAPPRSVRDDSLGLRLSLRCPVLVNLLCPCTVQ